MNAVTQKAKCPVCGRNAKIHPSWIKKDDMRFSHHKNGKGGTCSGWGEKVPNEPACIITEAAERIGARAELVTTGAQLCDENELGTRTKRITRCVYPDWEGGTTSGDHQFGRDGVCVICGEKNDIEEGAERIGAKAEICTKAEQLQADGEITE